MKTLEGKHQVIRNIVQAQGKVRTQIKANESQLQAGWKREAF